MPLPAQCCRPVQAIDKTMKSKGLSLRGGRRPTWQSREGSYVFADGFPVIRHCPARFPRRFAPRNDKLGSIVSLNLYCNHCQPAWRSGNAATDAIGAYHFIAALYQLQVRLRARLSAPLQSPPLKSNPARSESSGQDFFCSVIPQAARRSFRYRPCHSAGPTCRTSAASCRRPS